jgi:hypothetical protein
MKRMMRTENKYSKADIFLTLLAVNDYFDGCGHSGRERRRIHSSISSLRTEPGSIFILSILQVMIRMNGVMT